MYVYNRVKTLESTYTSSEGLCSAIMKPTAIQAGSNVHIGKGVPPPWFDIRSPKTVHQPPVLPLLPDVIAKLAVKRNAMNADELQPAPYGWCYPLSSHT